MKKHRPSNDNKERKWDNVKPLDDDDWRKPLEALARELKRKEELKEKNENETKDT